MRTQSASILLLLGLLNGPSAVGQESKADCAPQTRQTYTRGLERLALQLEERERSLTRRDRSLGEREADIKAAEAILVARIKELREVTDQLEKRLATAEDLDIERLNTLVRMADRMREKQAAALLLELDLELAARVLDQMNATKAGRALAAMPPKPASKIAERLTRPLANFPETQP
jgi:flagellar motility protein MotE (MotC chaperone)